jgi:hypothetical protein
MSELICHPVWRVRIQLAWPIDEASRAAAPIDKPLYKTRRKQGDAGQSPASKCVVALGTPVDVSSGRVAMSMHFQIPAGRRFTARTRRRGLVRCRPSTQDSLGVQSIRLREQRHRTMCCPWYIPRRLVRAALARNLLAAGLSRWSVRTTTVLLWGRSSHTRSGVLPWPGHTPRS